MPLAPLTLPALAIPCSWLAICIDLSDTLDKRQIRTQRSSSLDHLTAPCAQSVSLAAHKEMSAEPVFDRTPASCNVAWQTCTYLRFCNCNAGEACMAA